MITRNVSAQFIGNGRVLLRMNSVAQDNKNASAQVTANTVAAFSNDAAAISYTNLINQTNCLFGPKPYEELVTDVFQSSSVNN